MSKEDRELLERWIDENLIPRSYYNRKHPTGVIKAMFQYNNGNDRNPEVSFEDFNMVMEQKGFFSESPNKMNRLWKVKLKKPRY